MKIRLGIASVFLVIHAAHAGDVTTAPMGVMQYSFAANSYTTMGVPLVRDSVAAGTVSGGAASTITISGTQNLATVLAETTLLLRHCAIWRRAVGSIHAQAWR